MTATTILIKMVIKQNFTDDIKARFQELSLEQANRSMRLLAILNTDGNDKVLIGIICIRDNVRSSIKQTVETMNRAGVQVVMVTGDRKETAVAIAKEPVSLLVKMTLFLLTMNFCPFRSRT